MNDAIAIDKINPGVFGEFSMPGTWSDPYPFTVQSNPKPEPPVHTTTAFSSPMCDWGITYGDNTATLCIPPEKTCPLDRGLIPERNIEPGLWSLPSSLSTGKKQLLKPYIFLLFLILITTIFLRNHIFKKF